MRGPALNTIVNVPAERERKYGLNGEKGKPLYTSFHTFPKGLQTEPEKCMLSHNYKHLESNKARQSMGGGSRAFQRYWLLHIAINKARTRQVRVRGIIILACGAFAVAFESLKLCYTLVWNAAVCPIENMPTHKHSFQSMPEDQGTYCSTHRPTIYDICMLAYP